MADEAFGVSEERMRQIFDRRIVRFLGFHRTVPVHSGPPTVVLLGGQMAAGKSSSLAGIIERHGDAVTPISPDDFRAFHPDYEQIMAERPHDLVELTAPAMRTWNAMAQQYAHEAGYPLVIEGTFGHSPGVLKIVDRMAHTPESGLHPGFEAEVVGVAVSEYRSRLDMVGRYLSHPPGQGRWVPAEAHDRVYAAVPETMDALEADENVRRVIVTDRSGTVHYDNTRGEDGAWLHPPGAGEALKQARSEGQVPFGRQEAREWMASYWRYAESFAQRGEINTVTAPTMLALHTDADRIAPIAYADDNAALEEHRRWQTMQKAVVLAGQRGADNSALPHSPGAFLGASSEERAAYAAAITQSGERSQQVDAQASEAVRRARQGMAPPGQRPTAPRDQGRPRGRGGPDPGLER
ncbi:zeta toxin family protein [Nocardiopsis baichengensis]|uniref:zeta toxin family protein n=1 Tax=Nocardiopsis baichengensis TaxID=280240 RepID=UPI00036E2C6B|nr:zeta toxin family protein [Nocardiopsis baichengensis]